MIPNRAPAGSKMSVIVTALSFTVFVFIAGFVLFPDTVGWAVSPQSFSRALLCTSRDSDWNISNTCSYDVNVHFCLQNRNGSEYDWRCSSFLLTEGETRAEGDLYNALDNYAGISIYACRAPFAPTETTEVGQSRCIRQNEAR